MKYRALLIVPNRTRETKPEQALGASLVDLENWARMIIKHAEPGSEVVIYETVERPVCRILMGVNPDSPEVISILNENAGSQS